MLYKKTKNKQEGAPKDINRTKNAPIVGSRAYKILKFLKENEREYSVAEIADRLKVNTHCVHQTCRSYQQVDGCKKYVADERKWRTFYKFVENAVIKQGTRQVGAVDKLVSVIKKDPTKMYPAEYLSRKTGVSVKHVQNNLSHRKDIEIHHEFEGKKKINYYSIK